MNTKASAQNLLGSSTMFLVRAEPRLFPGKEVPILGACATPGQLLEVLISDSESAFSWFGVPR